MCQRKHLFQSLFFNNVADWSFLQRDSGIIVFLWILRNFYEHLFLQNNSGACFWRIGGEGGERLSLHIQRCWDFDHFFRQRRFCRYQLGHFRHVLLVNRVPIYAKINKQVIKQKPKFKTKIIPPYFKWMVLSICKQLSGKVCLRF